MNTAATGYCPVCHMIVDLIGQVLADHGRRQDPAAGGWTAPCIWAGNYPAPVPDTPEVAEAAFSDDRRQAKCPDCDNPEAIGGGGDTGGGGRLYMRGHRAPGVTDERAALCPGSWKLPEYVN